MRVRRSLRPALYAAVGVIVVLIATGITFATVGVQRGSGTSYQTVAGGAPNPAGTPSSNAAVCEQLVVPAYFSSAYWEAAIHAKHPPADMILDISGVGAGSAPEPEFKSLVKQATAAGISILGYSSTVDGARPIAQVEEDVQNYKAWYGVTDIFLDRVSGQPAQLSYYKQLDAYIHQSHAGLPGLAEPRRLPRPELYVGWRRGDGVRGHLRRSTSTPRFRAGHSTTPRTGSSTRSTPPPGRSSAPRWSWRSSDGRATST